MKHTTIKYDPILGAQMETVDIYETQTSLNQQQALKAATATRMAMVNKQRANNGRHK